MLSAESLAQIDRDLPRRGITDGGIESLAKLPMGVEIETAAQTDDGSTIGGLNACLHISTPCALPGPV